MYPLPPYSAVPEDKLDPFIKKWKNLLFLDC